ncbi:accessory Sec system S-layer assembly protein [Planococcus sp. CAU13]|uniref:accessory Sec system S-layer assembly protein n=1 Tax=Planococcus sp. CAU13 TaxID=1541197 RepID=UPI00052FFF10|nr:accessory Sec system S-layer assembly protein [Planococcus sp. CAU13]
MNLFPFFKKKERTGVDSTLDSTDILEETAEPAKDDESVKPSLALPPAWSIGKEQEYVLRFLSNELPSLKPNQISLAGISINLNPNGQSWNVEAFIRSSLDQPINLKTAELLLLDKEEAVIASHEFNLAEIGDIPAKSNLPWVFEFPADSISAAELPAEGWKLAFNIQSLLDHSLDLEEEWKERLSRDEQKKLTALVDSLPALQPNEVNITGFQSKFTDDNALAVSLLIRNGSKKNIQLNTVPLEVRDARDAVVAKGVFNLENFTVKRNTSKPWTFIFPKENLVNAEPDMSSWKALIIQE